MATDSDEIYSDGQHPDGQFHDRQFHISGLAIIGVGLIGGSVAMALKRSQLVDKVIGVGRSRENLELALHLGVIDEIVEDPVTATEQADVIILATPVNTIAGLFKTILPALDQSKVVTDVGSVKTGICNSAVELLGSQVSRFVPGHPVAGKEKSGVSAATADLFENHNVVLTPLIDTDADALDLICKMWIATGANVITMEANLHDRILSVTSHLPHVLAYAMVDFFTNSDDLAHCYDMAAGGFHDFTRTVSSDPEMWRDICLMNRSQILQHINRFKQRLDGIGRMIDESDSEALDKLFGAAKAARSTIVERRKQQS